MIRIGRRFGMMAVRIPAEPTGIVRAIDATAPRTLPAVVAPFTALLGRRLSKAGCFVPDRVFGLAWTGALIITLTVLTLSILARVLGAGRIAK